MVCRIIFEHELLRNSIWTSFRIFYQLKAPYDDTIFAVLIGFISFGECFRKFQPPITSASG